MSKRVLYPTRFVASVTAPEEWDRLPLPNLLHCNDPITRDQEIERMERWYRELQSGEKIQLKKRLRSMTFRDFWSAYYELMTSRIAHGIGALSVRHAPALAGKRPDFKVHFQSGAQIWEVATAYQTMDREVDDDKAHDLANRLNREFSNRWRVVVEAEAFGPGAVPLSRALPRIQAWLDRLEQGGPDHLRLCPPIINCELSLRAHPPRDGDEARPIVSALMGQGGNITATDRIRNVMRKKIKKYGAVHHSRAPLVVFLYEGDLLHISQESLEWALLGNLQVTFSPGQEQAPLSRAPGGLFLPGPDGRPQNTRLSAVVYCRRQWQDGAPHATVFVYHHPAARNPLPLAQFEPLPQCQITIRDTELRQEWTTCPNEEIQILPLV
jgi:hypothetical protein